MEILITERTDITPQLGKDWMKKFKLTIGRIQLAETNQLEREKVFNKFRIYLKTMKRQTIPGSTSN